MSAGPAWLRNLKPGDEVWFVPHDTRNYTHGELMVDKVGRKYVTMVSRTGLRFNLENGHSAPDQWPRGRIYHSRESYEAIVQADREWSKLKRDLDFASRPSGVTAEGITRARELLGMGK